MRHGLNDRGELRVNQSIVFHSSAISIYEGRVFFMPEALAKGSREYPSHQQLLLSAGAPGCLLIHIWIFPQIPCLLRQTTVFHAASAFRIAPLIGLPSPKRIRLAAA
jgi:hypothetical protein